jgi:hypothetical protein
MALYEISYRRKYLFRQQLKTVDSGCLYPRQASVCETYPDRGPAKQVAATLAHYARQALCDPKLWLYNNGRLMNEFGVEHMFDTHQPYGCRQQVSFLSCI